jgi:hypothetical protein
MPRQLSSEEIEVLARRRAGAKMGWYIHACVYLLVNVALYAMSDFGFGHRPWSRFPVFGWGVGLGLHGISVFVLGKGSAFRERMVDRERQRLQREQDRR